MSVKICANNVQEFTPLISISVTYEDLSAAISIIQLELTKTRNEAIATMKCTGVYEQ